MLLTVTTLFMSQTALAVPGQFTHQGRLLDADGAALDGEVTLTFRIADAASEGESLWQETQTVTLINGFYSAILGADETDNPLDIDVLNQAPIWMEIQVGDGDAMLPRTPIHSVPFASIASVANTVDWSGIAGVPADFEDGVDNHLSDEEVDAIVSDKGYAKTTDVVSADDLASIVSSLDALTAQVAELTTYVANLEADVATNAAMIEYNTTNVGVLLDSVYEVGEQQAVQAAEVAALQTTVDDLVVSTGALTSITDVMEVNSDGDVVFEATNVRIVSGAGSSDATPNGTGNLIVGYDENDGTDTKTGSHNFVVGPNHSYQTFGGIVAGSNNAIEGDGHAMAIGGHGNTVSGEHSIAIGGWDSTLEGSDSIFLKGNGNLMEEGRSLVVDGTDDGGCGSFGGGMRVIDPVYCPSDEGATGGDDGGGGGGGSVGGGDDDDDGDDGSADTGDVADPSPGSACTTYLGEKFGETNDGYYDCDMDCIRAAYVTGEFLEYMDTYFEDIDGIDGTVDYPVPYLGNGSCDENGEYDAIQYDVLEHWWTEFHRVDINFNCEEYDYDEGDCDVVIDP